MTPMLAMVVLGNFGPSLSLVREVSLMPSKNLTVGTGGAFSAFGRSADDQFTGRPPDFGPLPHRVFGGRPAAPVSPDARQTIEGRGFRRVFKIWSEQGELRHTFEMSGFDRPRVYTLNHIVLDNRRQWVLNDKVVDFPKVPTEPPRSYQILGPNGRKTMVWGFTNWIEGSPIPSRVQSAFVLWRPERPLVVAKPPPGYKQVIAQGVIENDWVAVRVSKSDLRTSAEQALTGASTTRLGPMLVEGEPRFWRDGTYSGRTPPPLPVPKVRDEWDYIDQEHLALHKWGPLEIYSSSAFPRFREQAKNPHFSKRLRWRLNGEWRTLREIVPGWQADEAGLDLVGAGGGGYLFLHSRMRRALYILKLPEEWLDMPKD